MKIAIRLTSSILIATTLATAGCRLGTNNEDKLAALRAGVQLDENGNPIGATPVISSVRLAGSTLTLTGQNIDAVQSVKFEGLSADFEIVAQTSTSMQLNAKSALALAVGTAYNLIVSSASADSSVPVTFELPDGSVTPAKLDRAYIEKDSGGNVGLGITGSAAAKLHVKGMVRSEDNGFIAITTAPSGTRTGFWSQNDQNSYLNMEMRGSAEGGTTLGVNNAGLAYIRAVTAAGAPAVPFALGTTGAAPLVFGTGNAQRMRIDSSGLVGIGTAAPEARLHVVSGLVSGVQSVKFDVNLNGTGDGVVINGNTRTLAEGNNGALRVIGSGGGDVIRATYEGRVGVMTTTPRAPLHVKTSGTGVVENLRLQGTWTSNPSGAEMRFTNTHASGAVPNTGEYNLAAVRGIDDNGSWGGALYFATAATGTSGGAALADRMVIKSDGKVGIGNNSPQAALDVNGGVRLATTTAKPTCNSTVRGLTWFTQGATGVKDSYEVCAKDASDAYAWRTLY